MFPPALTISSECLSSTACPAGPGLRGSKSRTLGGQRAHSGLQVTLSVGVGKGSVSFLFKQQSNFLGSEGISLLTPSHLASYQISDPIQAWSWLEQGEWAEAGLAGPADRQVCRLPGL